MVLSLRAPLVDPDPITAVFDKFLEKFTTSMKTWTHQSVEAMKQIYPKPEPKTNHNVLICGYTQEDDCLCVVAESMESEFYEKDEHGDAIMDFEEEEMNPHTRDVDQTGDEDDDNTEPIVPENGDRNVFQTEIGDLNPQIRQVFNQLDHPKGKVFDEIPERDGYIPTLNPKPSDECGSPLCISSPCISMTMMFRAAPAFSIMNTSTSEIEQGQEEVAMCLIMLSKDLSHWGGRSFIGESSDNNSDFIETEFCATEDGPKMDRSEAQVDGLIVNEELKSQVVEEFEFQVSEVEMQKNLIDKSESVQKAEMGTKKHNNSSKRKGGLDLFDPELGVNYSEMCKENFGKKSKFECASCNKAFNTYQALGGHRASHKKMKGCFGLKPDSSETTVIGADQNLSPNPTADKNSPIDQEMAADSSNGTKRTHKEGSHKCPICLRVFTSGQALGGHKRSHLIAEAKHNQNSTSIVIQRPIPEIRDFVDLNLPAPDEEDSNTSGLGFNPWWIGSNHKHEPLLGLL